MIWLLTDIGEFKLLGEITDSDGVVLKCAVKDIRTILEGMLLPACFLD